MRILHIHDNITARLTQLSEKTDDNALFLHCGRRQLKYKNIFFPSSWGRMVLPKALGIQNELSLLLNKSQILCVLLTTF